MPFNNRNDRRRSPEVERIPARDRISRPDRASNFRSLCIKGGWPRGVKDHHIIENVERVFRKFDDYNVKLAMVAGEKICYINFTSETDARVALEKMHKIHVFDRSLPLEPVIKGVLPVDPRDRDRKRSKSRSPAQVKCLIRSISFTCTNRTRDCGLFSAIPLKLKGNTIFNSKKFS